MKHYESLIELGCFSRIDIVRLLGNKSTADSLLREYLHKGYIERVRRDCYVTISLETKQPIASRYRIGSALFPDAAISHHSAFEIYGFSNQVYYTTYVMTEKRFSDFTYNGITYHRVMPSHPQHIVDVSGVHATSIEQTVIDSIADYEKIGGLEETVRCLRLIPSLDEKTLLHILEERCNLFLWQKVGYLLSSLKDSLPLSNAFFEECRSHKAKGKRSLLQNAPYMQSWNDEWNLYVPTETATLWNKGINGDDTI